MLVKHKVFAYITRANQLLVFEHPLSPEAGIQVPAGTIEPGEDPADAVLREAQEETGLSTLRLVRFLGEYQRDMSDFGKQEIHHRYYFHLIAEGDTPDTWRHGEYHPSDGIEEYIPFDFYWVDLPDDVPPLVADHGYLLNRL